MKSSEEYCLYEVKPGDSLSAIAAHFGHITPTQLAKINRLSLVGSGLPPVFPGQKILVPTLTTERVVPPTVRKAPGSAFRISSLSESEKHDKESFAGDLPDPASNLEELEQQFVKIKAQRKLLSEEFVDGVLLITPDCLCFDPTQTALEQWNADLASHSHPLSADDSALEHCPDGDSPTDRLADASHLGICVPLKQLCSMSTLKCPVRGDDFAPSSCEPVNAEPDNGGSQAVDISEAVQHSETPPDTPLDLDPVKHSPVLSDRQSPHSHLESCDELSPLVTASPSPPKDSLLLQLTEFAQNGADGKQHCFLISLDDLPSVFAFLLNLGVQSMQDKKSPGFMTSTALQKKSSVSGDSVVVHRSLIEEALEDLEAISLRPTLYGGESGILSDDMLAELGTNFPTHWIGANLRLMYRADQDGYSLGTMYRKSRDVEDGVLLVIRDTMNVVFGAIMSEAPHCSQHFYGTGETCVFHWDPEFKRYDWTKKNYFFMRGSANSFQIGGQSGHNAIWVDEALKYGRSEPTDTFDNPVLSGCLPAFCLDAVTTGSEPVTDEQPCFQRSASHDTSSPGLDSVPFVIDTLELWSLVT